MLGLGFSRFARRYLGNSKPSCNVDPYCYEPKLRLDILVSVPPGTEMFYFPGCARRLVTPALPPKAGRFPHSDISGSKVARHLPEAYRRHAASFIALDSQGIHRMPFRPPIRKSKDRLLFSLRAPPGSTFETRTSREARLPALCSCQRTVMLRKTKNRSGSGSAARRKILGHRFRFVVGFLMNVISTREVYARGRGRVNNGKTPLSRGFPVQEHTNRPRQLLFEISWRIRSM